MTDKNILITALTSGFILCLFILAFAEIPIYCPNCKRHLYDYQKEIADLTMLNAEDFKPALDIIQQPLEHSPMICPLCSCPLNLYESWAWIQGVHPPAFHINAVSLLTKDREGNFKGVPYAVKYEDWERK